MKKVAQLRAAGFVVQPSQDAVGCTEVLSNKLFWFYNPRFHTDMAAIHGHMKSAETGVNSYRLLVAGIFGASDDFPYALLSDSAKRELDVTFENCRLAREQVQHLTAAYLKTLEHAEIEGAAA